MVKSKTIKNFDGKYITILLTQMPATHKDYHEIDRCGFIQAGTERKCNYPFWKCKQIFLNFVNLYDVAIMFDSL